MNSNTIETLIEGVDKVAEQLPNDIATEDYIADEVFEYLEDSGIEFSGVAVTTGRNDDAGPD